MTALNTYKRTALFLSAETAPTAPILNVRQGAPFVAIVDNFWNPLKGRAANDKMRATLDKNGSGTGQGRCTKTAMGSQKRAFRNPYASSQHAAYMAQHRCKIGLGASARAFAKTILLISEPPFIFRLFSRFFTLFRLFLLLSICGARF